MSLWKERREWSWSSSREKDRTKPHSSPPLPAYHIQQRHLKRQSSLIYSVDQLAFFLFLSSPLAFTKDLKFWSYFEIFEFFSFFSFILTKGNQTFVNWLSPPITLSRPLKSQENTSRREIACNTAILVMYSCKKSLSMQILHPDPPHYPMTRFKGWYYRTIENTNAPGEEVKRLALSIEMQIWYSVEWRLIHSRKSVQEGPNSGLKGDNGVKKNVRGEKEMPKCRRNVRWKSSLGVLLSRGKKKGPTEEIWEIGNLAMIGRGRLRAHFCEVARS